MTIDANLMLGLPADGRTYDVAAEMLKDIGLEKVRLMTNNPLKIKGLEEQGIQVEERLQHQSGIGPENAQLSVNQKTSNGPSFKCRMNNMLRAGKWVYVVFNRYQEPRLFSRLKRRGQN